MYSFISNLLITTRFFTLLRKRIQMLKNHNISSWDRTVNRMFIFTHNIIASAIKVNHIPNIPLQLCLFLQFLPILKIIFIHLLPLYFLWKISLSLPSLLDDTCFIRHFILRINIIIHFFHLTKVKSQTRVKLQVESGLVGSGLVGSGLMGGKRRPTKNCQNHFLQFFSKYTKMYS